MGGAVIIAASRVSGTSARPRRDAGTPVTISGLLVLFLMTGLGLVGFLDDYIKICKQRSLGLRAGAKLAGQTLVGGGLRGARPAVPRQPVRSPPASTHISFIRDTNIDLVVGTIRPDPVRHLGLPHDRRHLERREPHRRPRRPRHRRLGDGLRGLRPHRDLAVQPELPDQPGHQVLRGPRRPRPRGGRGLRHGGLLRLPVVERLARQDLHGRHRLAGPRRGAGRPGDHHPHRAAGAPPRRPVRRSSPCR